MFPSIFLLSIHVRPSWREISDGIIAERYFERKVCSFEEIREACRVEVDRDPLVRASSTMRVERIKIYFSFLRKILQIRKNLGYLCI